MKKYIPLIILLLFVVTFMIFKYSSPENNTVEVVINVNNLDSQSIVDDIKNKIDKISGVEFIDASINSNIIVLKVDKDYSDKSFQEIFNDISINDIDVNIISN